MSTDGPEKYGVQEAVEKCNEFLLSAMPDIRFGTINNRHIENATLDWVIKHLAELNDENIDKFKKGMAEINPRVRLTDDFNKQIESHIEQKQEQEQEQKSAKGISKDQVQENRQKTKQKFGIIDKVKNKISKK